MFLRLFVNICLGSVVVCSTTIRSVYNFLMRYWGIQVGEQQYWLVLVH